MRLGGIRIAVTALVGITPLALYGLSYFIDGQAIGFVSWLTLTGAGFAWVAYTYPGWEGR